jgi:hypothetical protein
MSFQSRQRKRLAAYALERYGVVGHVLPYGLVAETLHDTYRERTLGYFAEHRIKWWTGNRDVGRAGSLHVRCLCQLSAAASLRPAARALLLPSSGGERG